MIEKARIEREIRYRSVSNMQQVMEQIRFSDAMDGIEDSVSEADAFLASVEDALLCMIATGQKMTSDQLQELMNANPMEATLKYSADLIRDRKQRSGVIQESIEYFLRSCHLYVEEPSNISRYNVERIVEWWYGRLGQRCCNDSRFATSDFMKWTVNGVSLYFLINYHIPHTLALEIVQNWNLSPKEVLHASLEYRSDEKVEEYEERLRESTDEEMAQHAHFILNNEACMIYHDELHSSAAYLLDAKRYDEWTELFIKMEYPVLQASMLALIRELPDLLGVVKVLLSKELAYPLTIFAIVRECFYNLCARTTANLFSYQEEFATQAPDDELKRMWSGVYQSWEKELPVFVCQGLQMLKSRLTAEDLAGWVFSMHDIVPPRKNATSDGHNHVTAVFKEELLKLYETSELPIVEGDLSYLTYVTNIYLNAANKPSRETLLTLAAKIVETVRVSKTKSTILITDDAIKDFGIVAALLHECYPDKEELFSLFERNRTWYEGWGVPKPSDLYDSCHSENYLLCWMLMVACLDFSDATDKNQYWERLMHELFSQISAAGGYIRSEYTQTLVLAGLIVAQAYQEGMVLFLVYCNRYVTNIDELITIMNNGGIIHYLSNHQDKCNEMRDVIDSITARIGTEWHLKIRRLYQEGIHGRQRADLIDKAAENWLKLKKR